MRRPLSTVSRVVALAVAVIVALGVITLVILTALGAFAGTKRQGPFSAAHPADRAQLSGTSLPVQNASFGPSYAIIFPMAQVRGPVTGSPGCPPVSAG